MALSCIARVLLTKYIFKWGGSKELLKQVHRVLEVKATERLVRIETCTGKGRTPSAATFISCQPLVSILVIYLPLFL